MAGPSNHRRSFTVQEFTYPRPAPPTPTSPSYSQMNPHQPFGFNQPAPASPVLHRQRSMTEYRGHVAATELFGSSPPPNQWPSPLTDRTWRDTTDKPLPELPADDETIYDDDEEQLASNLHPRPAQSRSFQNLTASAGPSSTLLNPVTTNGAPSAHSSGEHTHRSSYYAQEGADDGLPSASRWSGETREFHEAPLDDHQRYMEGSPRSLHPLSHQSSFTAFSGGDGQSPRGVGGMIGQAFGAPEENSNSSSSSSSSEDSEHEEEEEEPDVKIDKGKARANEDDPQFAKCNNEATESNIRPDAQVDGASESSPQKVVSFSSPSRQRPVSLPTGVEKFLFLPFDDPQDWELPDFSSEYTIRDFLVRHFNDTFQKVDSKPEDTTFTSKPEDTRRYALALSTIPPVCFLSFHFS